MTRPFPYTPEEEVLFILRYRFPTAEVSKYYYDFEDIASFWD